MLTFKHIQLHISVLTPVNAYCYIHLKKGKEEDVGSNGFTSVPGKIMEKNIGLQANEGQKPALFVPHLLNNTNSSMTKLTVLSDRT